MLGRVKSDDVRVYAVYLPMLRADQESTVPAAIEKLPDNRVSFYWDGKGDLGKSYSRVLQLGEGQPAWDVYMIYNRDAEWGGDPPAPDYWMHQLSSLGQERRLDGAKLAEETNKLLQAGKK